MSRSSSLSSVSDVSSPTPGPAGADSPNSGALGVGSSRPSGSILGGFSPRALEVAKSIFPVNRPTFTRVDFSRPPAHVLFAGYHPTLYFLPKVFVDEGSLLRSLEVTIWANRLAHTRVQNLIKDCSAHMQATAPNAFQGYKAAYDAETIKAMHAAARFYCNGRDKPPPVTVEDTLVHVPAKIWDGNPKGWMATGGLVARLLHALLFTSYREREIMYKEYPEFWDIVRCDNCWRPREMAVWCCGLKD